MYGADQKIPIVTLYGGLDVLILSRDEIHLHAQTNIKMCLLPGCTHTFDVGSKSKKWTFDWHVFQGRTSLLHLKVMF